MEWLEIVFVLAILLLLFGPSRMTDIARELGKAVYEFRRASSGIIDAATPPRDAKQREVVGRSAVLDDEAVMEIARRLGINAEGKSTEQLKQEILRKIGGEEAETGSTPTGG